jgi:small subunit ribosomal protein S5
MTEEKVETIDEKAPDVIGAVEVAAPEEIEEGKVVEERTFDKEGWKPKTSLGKKVKSGEISAIDQILDNGLKILESEIVDILIPNLETELLLIGQAKGKFGGGKRRVFKQTQKKTSEGNKPHFATIAVVGNRDGYIGLGYGKSKETVPAREKSIRNSKLNLFKIRRGCGSWQCDCKRPHSIPFEVEGKCGSVTIKLVPAPKGSGLKVEKECQKILTLAGIKDVWSTSFGQTRSKMNHIYACEAALRKLMQTKVNQKSSDTTGVVEGSINKGAQDE